MGGIYTCTLVNDCGKDKCRDHDAADGAVVGMPASSKRGDSCDSRQPDVSDQPLPDSLLHLWCAQLAAYDAKQPCWLEEKLAMREGTIVADTLAFTSCEFGERHGIELWAQRRPTDSPMHLHFDIDEEECRESPSRVMRCPAMTCVLYSSDIGGPTIVLAIRPGEAWPRIMRCFLCWPAAGHIFRFRGDWLHGVLVDTAAEQPIRCGVQRETIVLNLWDDKPLDVPALRAADVPSTPADAATIVRTRRERRSIGSLAAAVTTDVVGREDATWSWQSLTVGLTDGMAKVELLMPSLTRCNVHVPKVVAFDASVRNPPDPRKIGPFYG